MKLGIFFLPLLLAAQTATYPGSVVTDQQLKVLVDRAQTTLTGALNASATSISVTSSLKFAANVVVTIDSEQISICAVGSGTMTVGHSSCPNIDGRGFNGTAAASHTNTSVVSAYLVAWHDNAQDAELKALETTLGANLANIIALIPNPWPVTKGGTNAATAAGARTNLGAAASGANADITSLTGLTTPLTVAEGGTNAATAAGARASLGAAASGANADITSLTGLTTPLPIAEGGTGATSAQGNGSKVQMAGTHSGVAGATLCDDAGGNTTTSGCTAPLPTGTQLQKLRIKPNTGNNTTLEFASPDTVNAADYNFPAQTPGGTLAAGSNAITLTPVPLGVNGTDAVHTLWISGGTGTAEACKITGGAGTAGQTSGQIIMQCANSHSGAWTIQSSSAGIREASIALGGHGTVTLPNSSMTINATMVLPTAISMRGQGFSETGTSGALGSVLNCTAAADPCLVIADGLGTATGQGLSEYFGFKLYGAGSGRGLYLGGDPSSVFAPSTWCASYTRYRNVSVENFADALVIQGEANFVNFWDCVFAGNTIGIYVPSTAGAAQPINFYGTLVSVPSGNAIVQDSNQFLTTTLFFFGGQISGTVTGNQVAIEAHGVHFEPNAAGAAIVDITSNQQHLVTILGGLISTHGTGGSAAPYQIRMSGAGLYYLTVKDVFAQCDSGSTVPTLIDYRTSLGGSLSIHDITIAAAGVFTAIYNYIPSGGATPGLSVTQNGLPNSMSAAASGSVTLTNSWQDLTGATLTLARAGTWRITGTVYFKVQGSGDYNIFLLGRLLAGGVAQAAEAVLYSLTDTFATVSQQWVYTAAAGDVVKLQAEKSGGTGTSAAAATHTTITASWLSQ